VTKIIAAFVITIFSWLTFYASSYSRYRQKYYFQVVRMRSSMLPSITQSLLPSSMS